MDRVAFEAELARDGYETSESSIAPHQARPPHSHDVDVRLFILEGTLTLVRGGARESFGPGQTCSVDSGTPHEEHTGADGARYVVGRRAAARAQAAE